MSEHHPSCRPHNKSLVWHCDQCGENESAEAEVAALREQLAEAKKELDADECELTQVVNNQEREIKTLEAKVKALAAELERIKKTNVDDNDQCNAHFIRTDMNVPSTCGRKPGHEGKHSWYTEKS